MFRLNLDATMASLPHFSAAIQARGLAHGLDQDLILRLTLVNEEIFTNIHRHAYRDVTPGPLSLSIEEHEDMLVFEWCDEGFPAEEEKLIPPEEPEPLEGGCLGLLLCRKLVGLPLYRRDGSRNFWSLSVPIPVFEAIP